MEVSLKRYLLAAAAFVALYVAVGWMRLQWKDSVRFTDLHPAMVLAAIRVGEIFARFGVPAVITSGNDSDHMEGSLHYAGKALDFRTKNLTNRPDAFQVRDQTRAALGPSFTVLLEDYGLANEHLHVQYNG